MQVLRRIARAPYARCVLTIGNFDGVHRGHRAMLARLRAAAEQHHLPATVLTFEPHPREFFAPQERPARLTPLREKLTLLAECQVDYAHVCRFDAALARKSAPAFLADLVASVHGARHVVVGDDFRFGQGRAGGFAELQAAGALHGYDCEQLSTVTWGTQRVSSSAVRQALAQGDMAQAEALLGRPYVIAGHVAAGKRLGSSMGFPTANIPLTHRNPPLSGVFAVSVQGVPGAGLRAGVANLGIRPTLGGDALPVLEVHLLDWNLPLYGAHLVVNFISKLREEQRFADLDALRCQIAEDVAVARRFFAASPPEAHLLATVTESLAP